MTTKLDDLSSQFKPKVFELLARCIEAGIPVLIVDTLRTEAEEQRNLAMGVSWTTHSKHLPRTSRGLTIVSANKADDAKADAIDICPYDVYQLHGSDKLKWDANDPVWQRIGAIGEKTGLRWGGRFKPPAKPDLGHFELPSSQIS